MIQEVAAGKSEVVIASGHRWLLWDTFSTAGAKIQSYTRTTEFLHEDIPPLIEGKGFESLLFLDRIRHIHDEDDVETSLMSLLIMAGTRQATDPRDKVYALLGIAKDVNHSLLVPDYSKSISQVYKQLVEYFVIQDQILSVLRLSQRIQQHQLPSWAPDWSSPLQETSQPSERKHVKGYPCSCSFFLGSRYAFCARSQLGYR